MRDNILFAYILFFLFALICEIAGTLGGFGSSVLFVPMADFFWDTHFVLGLTSLLHNFSNTAKIILFRKTIDKKVFIYFGIPSLLLTTVGAYLTTKIDTTTAQWVLCVFLILFSVLIFFFPQMKLPPAKGSAIVSGGLAGFMAGLVGTGGAIRGLGMTAFNLERNFFVGTSAAIDFGVDASRFVIYSTQGFLKNLDWIYVPVLLLASVLGSYIGKLLLMKISDRVFAKIVLVFIFIMGISMLLKLLKVI